MRYKIIFILLSVLLGIVGCTHTADRLPLTTNNEVEIYTRNNPEAEQTFKNGDQIGVFPVYSVNGNPGTLGNTSNPMNICYTYNQGRWDAAIGEEIFFEEGTVDLYAFSPYDPDMSHSPGKLDLAAYPFDVSGNQNEKDCNFLSAKAKSVSPQDPHVMLVFYHLMARVEINLKLPQVGTSVQDVQLHNFLTQGAINLTNSLVTAANVSEVVTPIEMNTPTTGYDQTFEAFFPPQALAAHTPLFTLEYQGNTLIYYLSEDIELYSFYFVEFNLELTEIATSRKAHKQVFLTTPIIRNDIYENK